MFIEIPATTKSLARRKLLYNKGINDAKYCVHFVVGGKLYRCPYYTKWQNMIRRCLSDKYKEKYPHYSDCSVCDEWLIFSIFKQWMEEQDWHGKQLDKDIINPGNKIYSPKNCAFVSQDLNKLLTNHKRARGEFPQGVDLSGELYRAQISINGKFVHIGRYETTEEAERAYIIRKTDIIMSHADALSDKRVALGLIKHAMNMIRQVV